MTCPFHPAKAIRKPIISRPQDHLDDDLYIDLRDTLAVPLYLEEAYVDDVVHVAEADAVRTCRRLASHGFVLGGSTGTVVKRRLRLAGPAPGRAGPHRRGDLPDLGERYLDSVYADDWVRGALGPEVLEQLPSPASTRH